MDLERQQACIFGKKMSCLVDPQRSLDIQSFHYSMTFWTTSISSFPQYDI
jgi:hypothetical protein